MQEHRERDQTRKLIVEVIQSHGRPLTRTQISRALNRKKSPHLITLIDEMAQENLLTKQIVTFHNGVTGYVYSLPHLAESQPRRGRRGG